MDTDEVLARRLQAEEFAMSTSDTSQFNLEGTVDIVLRAEDPLLQALAMSLMPLDEMQAAAADTARLQQELCDDSDEGPPAGPVLAEQDYLVQQLLTWFKTNFFSWVDSPKCSFCSSTQMASSGIAPPTAAEAAHQASRAELHRCLLCSSMTRFPRYNDVGKLLETRCGRCGEWANAFLLCCRAAGIDARYVRDWSDHVWTEYYSTALGRWVHLDACEAAFDKPLLYEAGWGKKLHYVVAVGRDGVMDVAKRYTASWSDMLQRRTLVAEDWLAEHITTVTRRLRAERPAAQVAVLEVRDAAERTELDSGAAAARGDVSSLSGRQSGSEAWRNQRHESGGDAAAAPVAAAKPPTAYVRAADDNLPAAFSRWGRLTGGVCRASADNSPSEPATCAFDGSPSTKWLDFGGGGASGRAWIEYRLLQQAAPVVVTCYDLVSANDCQERDPCDWVLEALVPGEQHDTSAAVVGTAGTANGGNQLAAAAAHMGRKMLHPAAMMMDSSGDGVGGLGCSSSTDVQKREQHQHQQQPQPQQPQPQPQRRWVVIDQRRGQHFPERHQLRSFTVDPSRQVTSRSFRLTITRARDPGAATCMQLACLNLYSKSADTPMLDMEQLVSPLMQPTTQVAAGVYVHPCHHQLATVIAAHACHLEAKQSSVLCKILANLVQHPSESKFRRLREIKVEALAQDTAARALLFAAGFRPVLGDLPNVSHEVFLQADNGSGERMRRLLSCC